MTELRLEQRPQGLGDLPGEPGVSPPAQEVVEGEVGEAEGAVDLGLGGLVVFFFFFGEDRKKEEVERLSTQQKEVPRFPILRLRCPFSKERFPLDVPCEAPESPSHWRAAAASLLGQASPPKTMMRSPMMKHQKSALASPEARPRPCCFGPNPLLERGAGLPPLSEAAAGEQRAPSAAGTGASLVRLALSLKSSGGGHKKRKKASEERNSLSPCAL